MGVLQGSSEMEQYSQLRTVSNFLSTVFLQLKCDPGKDQAKCWGPIFPEGCRGARGASSELVGFTSQSTRCRVEDLIEIEISNGRGDENVVKRKVYNEDDNISIVEERRDSEGSKDEERESSEDNQLLMYKTYIDKYK